MRQPCCRDKFRVCKSNQGLGALVLKQPLSLSCAWPGYFLDAGSDPLVLVNGVPGSISNPDLSMIESVSVLKDLPFQLLWKGGAPRGEP